MKVSELIHKLDEFDPDLDVIVSVNQRIGYLKAVTEQDGAVRITGEAKGWPKPMITKGWWTARKMYVFECGHEVFAWGVRHYTPKPEKAEDRIERISQKGICWECSHNS